MIQKNVCKKRLSILGHRERLNARNRWFRKRKLTEPFYQLWIILFTKFCIGDQEEFEEAKKVRDKYKPLDPAEFCETCCGTFHECSCTCDLVGDICSCTDTHFEGIPLSCDHAADEPCDQFCSTEARNNNQERTRNAKKALKLTKKLFDGVNKYRKYLYSARAYIPLARSELTAVSKQCHVLEACRCGLMRDAGISAVQFNKPLALMNLFFVDRKSVV